MSSPRIRTRGGFTLIELMAATAIAGMMVIVTMEMLGHLTTQVADGKQRYHSRPWLNVLKAQIQSDFAHCRSIIVKNNELRLDGYTWQDPETGVAQRRPTQIIYQLPKSANRGWLMRKQVDLTGNINSAQHSTVVCFGIARFEDLSRLQLDVPPGVWRMRLHLLAEGEEARSDDDKSEYVDWVFHRHGGFVR